MARIRYICFWAWIAVFLLPANNAQANLIPLPDHSHDMDAVTWDDGHTPIREHQHQHRTGHDPRSGLHVHSTGAGAQAYVSDAPGQVWVGRDLVVVGGAHPFPNEFAHGHQGHELPVARYDVHPTAAGGDITAVEAAAWNASATTRAFDAFNGIGTSPGWLDIGNASGPRNWPSPGGGNSDLAEDPAGGGIPAGGTGVPWHSSVDWRAIAYNSLQPADSHELHVVYGEAGSGALGATGDFTPGHNSPGLLTLTMDDDVDWYYGVNTAPLGIDGIYGTADDVSPHAYDFASVILHEAGHVLGLDHFGSYAAGQIMNTEANPLRDDHIHVSTAGTYAIPQGGTVTMPDGSTCMTCMPGTSVALPAGATINYPAGSGTLHTIDPDAIHGIRDLYAIVPVPSTLLLCLAGIAVLIHFSHRVRTTGSGSLFPGLKAALLGRGAIGWVISPRCAPRRGDACRQVS